jgi:hypothetical protein
MKRNDIALLIVIVGLSALAAYFIGQSLLGSARPKAVDVDSVIRLSQDVPEPSPAIFQEKSYNPTIKVKIGDQANQQPFNAAP